MQRVLQATLKIVFKLNEELAKKGFYIVTVESKTPTEFLQLQQQLILKNTLSQNVYQQKYIHIPLWHVHFIYLTQVSKISNFNTLSTVQVAPVGP